MGNLVAELSLELIETLRPLLSRIMARDKVLKDQIRGAASSVALNIGEGEYSDPGNRRARYFTAAGSAGETLAAVRVAVAWGIVSRSDAERSVALLLRISRCCGSRRGDEAVTPRRLEGGADDGDGGWQVAQHDLGGKPHDAVDGTLKAAVPAGVRSALRRAAMVRAVHLYDEAPRRNEEVHDAPRDDSLAAEPDVKLRGAERLPERALRRGGGAAHGAREAELASELTRGRGRA